MGGRSHYAADRRRPISFRPRRLALAAVAGGLVVAFGALATFSPQRPISHHAMHAWKTATHKGPKPYGGEPRLSESSTAPRAPRTAALRFVRAYAAWEAGRRATFLARNATER